MGVISGILIGLAIVFAFFVVVYLIGLAISLEWKEVGVVTLVFLCLCPGSILVSMAFNALGWTRAAWALGTTGVILTVVFYKVVSSDTSFLSKWLQPTAARH